MPGTVPCEKRDLSYSGDYGSTFGSISAVAGSRWGASRVHGRLTLQLLVAGDCAQIF